MKNDVRAMCAIDTRDLVCDMCDRYTGSCVRCVRDRYTELVCDMRDRYTGSTQIVVNSR